MSDETKNTADTVVSPVPEKVEPKEEMTNDEGTSPPQITSKTEDKDLETNPKRKQVNKKLSKMSKNTKEKQKNRALRKPTSGSTPQSSVPPGSLSKLLNINPMYLLGLVGVLIAGVSLWYQQKSYLKDEQQSDDEQDDQGPKHPAQHSSGDETSNFFGPTSSDLRSEVPPPVKKDTAQRKHKGPNPAHMDPLEWK